MKYTIKLFRDQFHDDKSCLAYIFKNRYPDGLECVKCGKKEFYPVDGRRSYACACGYQVYPTEGTIFHKSPTSLVSWFHAIFLMSQSKNGVAAMEVMRQIGVTYKCAWRICRQIRMLMKGGPGPLSGVVETDETTLGSKSSGKDLRSDRTLVLGHLQRRGGVKLKVIRRKTKKTLIREMKKNVARGSEVMSDRLPSYWYLPRHGYSHGAVNHGAGEYVRGTVHVNSIDGFWSQLKRSISGTYHSVSKKHLPSYLDEFAFRYEHCRDETPIPVTLFSRVGRRVEEGRKSPS